MLLAPLSIAWAQEEETIPMSEVTDAGTQYADGIQVYDRFNERIGGDSLRYCNGRLCDGWVEDYHSNGKLKHRGYYAQGRLISVYFNYYESGQLEREFHTKGDNASEMTSYYSDGQVHSKIRYKNGEPLEWEEYYSNGKLEFQEVNHRSFEYHIVNKFFYESGLPQSEMVLVDKKKLIFDKREYYSDGKVQLEGQVRYSKDVSDYVKVGTWKAFDEKGAMVSEDQYDNDGRLKSKP